MNDSLEHLVRHADERTSHVPRITAEQLLCEAVARRRRQAMRRGGAAGVTLLLLAAVATWFGAPPQSNDGRPGAMLADAGPHAGAAWSLKRPGRSADAEALRRELAQLEREAALH